MWWVEAKVVEVEVVVVGVEARAAVHVSSVVASLPDCLQFKAGESFQPPTICYA